MRTLRRICPSDIMHIDKTIGALQHRAEHVLGVLLLREGLPAARDRRARLRRLRPAGPQRSRPPRRAERHDRLADQVPQRHGKELPFAHHHKPWGTAIPKLADVPGPSKEMRAGELLYNEPKYIRLDEGGLRSLKTQVSS